MYYGVEANYLIFNGFTRYNTMREMQAMLAVTEFNMAETYLQILNDIRSAYANYDTAYKRYQIYQSLIPLARQERELVRDLYLVAYAKARCEKEKPFEERFFPSRALPFPNLFEPL